MENQENIAFPKITVITPSFNQGQYLEQTILSVLNQKYPRLEYIIVDGGSSDNSVAIINKYAEHLAYWVSEKDSGQSEAINKGLARATGDIVTWLNSDDYYEPTALHTAARLFNQQADLSVLHGKTMLFGESVKKRIVGLEKDILPFEYLSSMKIAQPSSFFSRSAMQLAGPLNPELHYAMDFELVVKAVLLGLKIRRIDDLLSHYRLHMNSKSMDEMKFLPEWSQVVYNFFSSVPGGDLFCKSFETLGIKGPLKVERYAATMQLKGREMEQVFLQHLNLHYHFNYRFFNYAVCRKISSYLEEHYKDFYTQENINKYDLRLKLIPKFIFRFVKKFRR